MPSLAPPTLDELTIAAIKLLDAIVEYHRDNPTRISTIPINGDEDASPRFQAISAMDLCETDQEVLRLRDSVANPIGNGLKRELKKVGQAIYDIVGSVERLQDVGEKIASTDPDQYQRRMSPLDSAWNGVGRGDNRWWS